MREKIEHILKQILFCIAWIAAFLIALFPAKYINSIYGYLPFFFMLFLVCLSAAHMFWMRHKIAVETDFADISCERGRTVTISLKIVNHSILVCPRACACFYISDLFGNDDSIMKTDFTLAGKEKNDFCLDMDMKHIGVYHVGLKEMVIYDMLGVFKTNVPVIGDFQVNVTPRIHNITEIEASELLMYESDRDTNHVVNNGMDYTGVREYEPGDSMKQIHWKLSAHSNGYLTKLNESSRQSDYTVILDFAAPDYSREELMDVNDCLIEMAFSLLEYIDRHDAAYSLIYCDHEHEIHRTIPTGRDSYIELIKQFSVITPDPKEEYADGAAIIRDESSMPNRSNNVIICTSRVTSQLIQELIWVKSQKRYPELYLIIPERLNSRERENLMAPLRILDDADIRYNMISTKINQTVEVLPE